MSERIECLLTLTAILVLCGCCRLGPDSSSTSSVNYDTAGTALLKTNWPGISIVPSEGPGTYPYLTNMAVSFYKSEQRWPTSATDLAKFAAKNNILFRKKDYPNSLFVVDEPNNDLKISYSLVQWTLKLSVPAPTNTYTTPQKSDQWLK